MKRILTISAASLALSVGWSGGARAQIVAGPSEPEPVSASPDGSDEKLVEGRIVDIQQNGSTMTVLKLDNGKSLVLPAENRASSAAPKVGDDVMAHYVDRNGSEVTTFLRITEVEAP